MSASGWDAVFQQDCALDEDVPGQNENLDNMAQSAPTSSVIAGGGQSTATDAQPTTTATEPETTETTGTTQTTSSRSSVTTTEQSTAAGPAAQVRAGPTQVLDAYWAAIASRNFPAAWRRLAPGAGQSEPEFVAGERQARITGASFSGRIISNTGSTASVRVESLITHDHEFGCRSWSGSYTLVHLHGQWLIQNAGIAPRACD